MPRITGYVRNRKLTRISAAGVTAAGAAAIALTGVAGTAHAAEPAKAPAKPAAVQQVDGQKSAAGSSSGNLDAWINQALDIMHKKGIPGTKEGIKRNIMRESAGNPNAVNQTDINAQNGTPSKGLLQMIQPTFQQYHVQGTPNDVTNPVANIVAACNYAADRYGSMDNVDSAY